jgi:enterochelin esterase-like enzyme
MLAAATLCCSAAEPAPGVPPGLPPGFVLPPPTPNDTLISPEVASGGRVTFRVYAPTAKTVKLDAEMLPLLTTSPLSRRDDGVWSLSVEAVPPGTYRYNFIIDDVGTVDPKNPNTSSTQTTVKSLMHVSGPGSEFEDALSVPHGAVAEVYYNSSVFGERRMHVYTPPGYERGSTRYPVLYLLHGGGDADASWSTVGRAGFILDNLIAAGKAKAMIIIMPAGHVPSSDGKPNGLAAMGPDAAGDPFTKDLLDSIVPYVDSHYRTAAGVQQRALAGLSMGGVQTLNIGLAHPEVFSQLGIFSSGWFPDVRQQFESRHSADLDRDASRLRLLWVAYGEADIARSNSEAMLQMFDRHQLKYHSEMTPGGHTWFNWRHDLNEFAPLLFR